jgi:hypothetical protein
MQRKLWSERWRGAEEWLGDLESSLRRTRALVREGGHFDRWDLSVVAGPFGRARALLAVEEHGQGRQYLRFRVWPAVRRLPLLLLVAGLAAAALADHAWLAGGVLATAALALSGAALRECGCAQAEIAAALRAMEARVAAEPEIEPQVLEPAERLAAPRA